MQQPTFSFITETEKPGFGKFIVEPLEQGYGHTLGNGLRRVLLSSLPGSAVTTVKIEGVQHQYSTLAGMKEDIVEFVLNVKKIRLVIEGNEEVVMTISKKGPGVVVAGDIECPAGVTIVNPELVLGTLSDKKSSLDASITAIKGYGFLQTEENQVNQLGVIPLDASFSPIERVNYRVESTRVGRMTNLDKLVLEVWTDATIKASDAVRQAAEILVMYFSQIVDPRAPSVKVESTASSASPVSDEVLKMRIEELDIPTRIVNALAKAKIETIGQIISMPRPELLKIKNLGAKSLSVVAEQIEEKGVKLME